MNKNIIDQLIAHGHSKESIKDMSYEQLQEIFDKETKARIEGFIPLLQQEGFMPPNDDGTKNIVRLTPLKEFWQRIVEHRDEPILIYDVLDEMVREYPANDIVDFFAHVCSGSLFKSLEGMLEIKWCEYQEILLDKIQEYYANLPEDELESQMAYYTRIRFNVERLEFVIRSLKKHSKELISMAGLKEMIRQEFFLNEKGEEEI